MAIYCNQCGASLPDDAIFCLKCGKPIKVESTASSKSTSKSGEVNLFSIQVKKVFKTEVPEDQWPKEWGEGTCTVTNKRLIFQTKKGATFHIFLRDLDGVRSQSLGGLWPTYIVWLDGYGYLWCKNKGENDKLASEIRNAMLTM